METERDCLEEDCLEESCLEENSDEDSSSKCVSQDMSQDLYSYQKQAINILRSWEKSESLHGVVGGILAFKQGMGKTRTMLELFYQNKQEEAEPNLVVCKKSNVQIWIKEIDKFYEDKLEYLVLYKDYLGSDPTKVSKETLNQYDVIITTYEVVRDQFYKAQLPCFIIRETNLSRSESKLYRYNEIPNGYKININKKLDPESDDATPQVYTSLFSNKWNRIIADESTEFSKHTTKLCYAMIGLCGNSYFCLSGTPIKNYSLDLYSQFRFMGALCFVNDWKKDYYEALSFSDRILVRGYDSTEITLPELKIKDYNLELSPVEKEMYNEIIDQLGDCSEKYESGNAKFAMLLSCLTRFRQVCICAYITLNEAKRSSSEDKVNIFKQQHLNDYITDKTNLPNYTKMKKALKIIKKCIKKHKKVIVFSMFVSALDILQLLLQKKGIPSLMLEGSTIITKREKVVKEFNENDAYSVILCSYKTGGLGISLTSAQAVLLLDPWWNTSTEEQAIYRAHRIGQKNMVTVYRLNIANSFENHIIKIQNKKNELCKDYMKNMKISYERQSTLKEIINNILQYGYL